MAQKTDADLLTQKQVIEGETSANANTASRVGQMFEDIIDSKMNNGLLIDEDDMSTNSATRVPSQQSVKAYVDAQAGETASAVTFTPAGNIAATDVQAGMEELDSEKLAKANTATALTDGASIDITGAKHTLTSDEATVTFSQSYTGDYSNIDVTLNTTAATWTFPAGSLCVVEGTASGNNTATITATSGDKIVISIWFVAASTYRVVVKNFGQ